MKKITVSIRSTNNPSILKFEADHSISGNGNYEYANIDEAKNSPLAQQLFYLPFIKTIYISGNFIAAEKYDIVTWEDVQDEVAKQIEAYLNSGKPVILETTAPKNVVTIYSGSTPNPAAMKFVANKKLVSHSCEFKNIDDAENAPLAKALFHHFPFVKEVFFAENYISVTKDDSADWGEITGEVREFIRDFIADGKEIVDPGSIGEKGNSSGTSITAPEHLDETSREIVGILEEYVKPAVAGDGGNIVFDSYDETQKTVKVILQGACSGCPSSTITLKNGIESMLKSMLDGKVNEVIALNG